MQPWAPVQSAGESMLRVPLSDENPTVSLICQDICGGGCAGSEKEARP